MPRRSEHLPRLRATITVEYSPVPEYYGTEDPCEMAAIDERNWRAEPMDLLCSFDFDPDGHETIAVEVKPI